MNPNFNLEFVGSGVYFVQDENNFIHPLVQVESGSDAKSLGSGSGRLKINGYDRILLTGSVVIGNDFFY